VILVPVDLSDVSRAVLDRAVRLADAVDEKLTLMHVIEPMVYPRTAGLAHDMIRFKIAVHEEAEKDLRALAAQADPASRRIATVETLEGSPADAIIGYAKAHPATFIVMGTHGRTGLNRLFTGSVAERVVRLAPSDVLVVRTGPSAADVRVAA